MALTYPLALASFQDMQSIVESTFALDEAMLANRTGGGEIISSAIGTRLWRGRLTCRGHAYIDLDQMTARVDLLRRAGTSFLVTLPSRIGPQLDPDGAILGASTPEITAIASNNVDVTIGGLPAGYQLRRGDLMSWTYLSSPTRYALHQVVTNTTANGSGVMTVEIMPPVRPGYVTPIAITLIRPVCKAVIVPGSYQPPTVTRQGPARFSFDWQQTLR